MEVFLVKAFVFGLGLIIGSFLNVIILRLDTGLGFGGRSQCFSCGKTLKWYELIPVFSFLFQKGKCRKCGSKISWQYPVVELLTGLMFLLVFTKLASGNIIFVVLLNLILVSSLMVISVFDIRHQQIPNVPLLVFYACGLGLMAIAGLDGFFLKFIQAFLVALPLLILWLVSRGRWLGFGDVLLALGVGFWLGLSSAAAAVLLSFWIGAVFAILLMLVKRKRLFKVAIPFGPFIALGSLVSFLYTIDIEALLQFFSWF